MCFMLPSSRFVRGCCRPCFKPKTVGAYRIRPSWRGKCTSNDGVMLGDIVSFSPTSGRMRYAPTPVRLLSWLNTVNHYPCSIEILACTMPTIGSDGMFLRFLHKEKRDESTVTTGKSVLLPN